MAYSEEEKFLALQMLANDCSVKTVMAECGMSRTMVKSLKKELKAGTLSSEVSLNTDGDKSFNNLDYITRAEQKYIAKLEGELSLFEDSDEGWVFHLTESEIKKVTSGLWWMAIMYPTKEDPNGKKRIHKLRLLGFQIAISPLHDKDTITEEDGRPRKKKAHWHIIIKCETKMSFRELNTLIRDITYGPYIKKCYSLKGTYEYFTHLNHPEKYQYEASEIQKYNGFVVEANRNERNMLFDYLVSEITNHPEIDSLKKLAMLHQGEYEMMGVIGTKGYTLNKLLCENWNDNHPDHAKKVELVQSKK